MLLPREFELVAACCRWPPSPAREDAVRAAAAGADWDLVARIAERHRVEGLVWAALRNSDLLVPPEARERLQAAADRIARQNLVLAAESLRLTGLLERAQVRHLFVKGISLSILAYGSIAPKMGWDIDLLVPPGSVETAAEALEGAGYRLLLPSGPAGRRRLGLWHLHWKESVWVSPGGRLTVELHSRLNDNPLLLPGIGPDSPSRQVEVSKGRFLATLRTDELFAYLCVHGASSAWFRLKWIADVGALIGGCPPEEVERLYRRSQEMGAGRAAAQALLLCERLLNTAVPPALGAELRSDRINRWLLGIALRKLAGRTLTAELDEKLLGTGTLHLMQFALMPGLRFKYAELRRRLINPADRIAVPLPKALNFLYPLVAVSRRLGRRTQ
ncbi:MAG TPA: nucleotidyltransferase family protein [Allosphingosinicella sp.]|nr:nucleotidyltransferase family protein [Allosphingosinicella sp.]